jgi:uncharacterized phiE125 gp8 family phage protein
VGEARDYAKVEIDDDDVIIDDLIKSSRQWAENYTRKAFINQTWTMKIDWCFPNVIELPVGPLQSVTAAAFTYVDSDGNDTQVPTSVYTVDTNSDPGRIYLAFDQLWPTNRGQRNAITLDFIVGYGIKPNNVPSDIRQAILMMTTYHYEARQPHAMGIGATMVTFPKTVDSLLLPYAVMT